MFRSPHGLTKKKNQSWGIKENKYAQDNAGYRVFPSQLYQNQSLHCFGELARQISMYFWRTAVATQQLSLPKHEHSSVWSSCVSITLPVATIHKIFPFNANKRETEEDSG